MRNRTLLFLLIFPMVSMAKAPTGEEAAQAVGAIVMEVTGITPAIEAVADALGLSNDEPNGESAVSANTSNGPGTASEHNADNEVSGGGEND